MALRSGNAMAETTTQRLRSLLQRAQVQHTFDEDDLKDIVSSASDSSGVHLPGSGGTPSTLGMVSGTDDSLGSSGDNGSIVSRLSLPGHMLDELTTPQVSTRGPSHLRTPPTSGILKTPTFGSDIHLDNGAALRRCVDGHNV